jgi:hypothetical protein
MRELMKGLQMAVNQPTASGDLDQAFPAIQKKVFRSKATARNVFGRQPATTFGFGRCRRAERPDLRNVATTGEKSSPDQIGRLGECLPLSALSLTMKIAAAVEGTSVTDERLQQLDDRIHNRNFPRSGSLLQRLAKRNYPVDAGQERWAVESSVAVSGRQLAAGLLPLGDVLRRAEHQVHAGQRCTQRAVLG